LSPADVPLTPVAATAPCGGGVAGADGAYRDFRRR